MGCGGSKNAADVKLGTAPPANECMAVEEEERCSKPMLAGLVGDPLNNICLLTDSYKVTHHLQYPEGTTRIYSYFESRGGDYEEICFFGLQYFLKKYLVGEVVTKEKVDEAQQVCEAHFGNPDLFNRNGWDLILKKYKGMRPVKIRAVPEGTVVPTKNVVMTVENTDDQCFWLTNYLETLLVQVWFPTTVCTVSRDMKKKIIKGLIDTGVDEEKAKAKALFKLYDFGFRSVSSVESACLGGLAHLVNFRSTNNTAALICGKEFYGEACAGQTMVQADDNAIMCWQKDKEQACFENLLKGYENTPFACMIDTYDTTAACKTWAKEMKAKLYGRKDSNQVFVQPNSNTGDLGVAVLKVLDALTSKDRLKPSESKGFKLLPEQIRVLQGDDIDPASLQAVIAALSDKKWSLDNMAFGCGSSLLQKLHRDTQKCAFKCSFARVNGQEVNVVKDPITDPGKKSKAGRLTLEKGEDGIFTTKTEGSGDPQNDILVDYFVDGKLVFEDTLDNIRKRSEGEDVPVKVEKPTFISKTLWKPMEKMHELAAELAFGEDEDPMSNVCMLTDSYKANAQLQYPPSTKYVYSYFECKDGKFDEVCFFGLQYYLKKYLVGQVVTSSRISEAKSFYDEHFAKDAVPFNKDGWDYILTNRDGKLPVSIRAVPEGTVLTCRNVLMTIVNTDEKCFWLPNYLESLLTQVWYPTTVCTQSREQKQIIKKYLTETGTPEAARDFGRVGFKLHDFGFRGVSSVESAGVGGAAHLVNFQGTDTLAAVTLVKHIYSNDCAGFSIPASEHSTITSWGKERELDAYRNMLTKYPTGLVACVSDSYNIYDACEKLWGGDELKKMIEERQGCLIVRPDSGELPGTVIDVLEKLGSRFTPTETSTKHKLLPPCIRVIQGDGVDIESMRLILEEMKKKGWAADNLAFGSGGALLQKLNRDVQKCNFKTSFVTIGADGVGVCTKVSKQGKLTLQRKNNGQWVTVAKGNGDPALDNLVEVYKDGALLVHRNFQGIRDRADLGASEFAPQDKPKTGHI